MIYKSINPKNGKLLKSFDFISNNKMHEKLEKSTKVYKFMKNQGIQGLPDRLAKFQRVKALMLERRNHLAETLTNEMGKTLKESFAEIDKSISMIDYYETRAEGFLQDEVIPTRFKETKVMQ